MIVEYAPTFTILVGYSSTFRNQSFDIVNFKEYRSNFAFENDHQSKSVTFLRAVKFIWPYEHYLCRLFLKLHRSN